MSMVSLPQRLAAYSLPLFLAAGAALAQTPAGTPAPTDAAAANPLGTAPIEPAMIAIIVVVIATMIGGGLWLMSRQNRAAPWSPETFHDAPTSKFDQLQAEIQGLSLRVSGGESKGMYRKIHRLARVFMERVGCGECIKMNNAELKTALRSDALKGDEGNVLSSIFERCEKGAQDERETLDFTASELLRELKQLTDIAEGAVVTPKYRALRVEGEARR